MAYKKPKVVNSTCSSEPIEAGCCLRSCGGTPVVLPTKQPMERDVLAKLKKEEKG